MAQEPIDPIPIDPPIIVPPCPLDCWWPASPAAQLEKLTVDIAVSDVAIRAQYTLRLTNPQFGLAEGRLVIPVPPDSAVVDLALSDGSQTLEGRILDADEAQRIYDEIVRRLIDPALLRSLGDDLYEVRAFPVPAGEEREVRFTVVTPLASVGRQVDVLVPWSRMSPRPAAALVQVAIDVPWEVRGAVAPGFAVDTTRSGGGQMQLSWESPAPWLAGSDFQLYVTGGEGLLDPRLLAYRLPDEDGYFALLIAPQVAPEATVARDVVLVLDTSGSMDGVKLAQTKDAAADVLARLGSDDRFGIVAFASQIRLFDVALRPAADSPAGSAFIDGLAAGGGTNIEAALEQAFRMATGDRSATIIFLTDGLPTVGAQVPGGILDAVNAAAMERTQLFAFGVGFDVNTVLLDMLSTGFTGSSHYVTPDEDIAIEVDRLWGRIESPVLTDVLIEIAGGETYAVAPQALTGVFAGDLTLLAGRFAAAGAATFTISGNAASGSVRLEYPVVFSEVDVADPTIAQLWAQCRIADLLTEALIEGSRDSLIDEIVAIATQFGIVTPYTAFLAEDPNLVFSPLGADAVAEETASAPTTGAGAVGGASDLEALRDGSLELGAQGVRVVGSHTFYLLDGAWVQDDYQTDTDAPPLRVDSAEFAVFLEADPDLGSAAALGSRVVTQTTGGWVTVVWPDLGPTTDVVLTPGWNLVGASVSDEITGATASIAGRFRNLFIWEPGSQEFGSFAPQLPAGLNTAQTFDPGDGVWIFVSDPAGAVWVQPAVVGGITINLMAGLNLVGWFGPDGTAVADAVASITGLTAAHTYDGTTFLSFAPDLPIALNTATTIDHGDGLWLQVTAPTTWDQPAP